MQIDQNVVVLNLVALKLRKFKTVSENFTAYA